MGLFDRVEQRLERAVNGAFARAFKSEVQPVEIASAIRRAMDDRAAVVGHGRTFVPNLYTVELSETDFERAGVPKPFIPRFPDIHPAFGRLVSKTFTHDLGWRFPTDESAKEDPSGFSELINTLEVLARTLDNCRLEIASWTTTGIIRTGNEDAFALLHTVESRIDDVGESALLLLWLSRKLFRRALQSYRSASS